jgi:dipeptidyl aminopeptidase/acylaminoacyl peptidase
LLAPADEFFRLNPRFSPDGTRLTYQRLRASGPQQESTTILVTQDGDEETPLSSTTASGSFGPTDWSADGQRLLGSCRSAQGRLEICLAPLSAAPYVERAISVVATHPDLNLFTALFSPDQRWIAIQGVQYAGLSTIYAMPAAGGAMAQITEGQHWDDKQCWGPDGRMIYFVSDRGGFLNVWGIRFDPATGTRMGEPFRVTTFESPRQMVFPRVAPLQLRVIVSVPMYRPGCCLVWKGVHHARAGSGCDPASCERREVPASESGSSTDFVVGSLNLRIPMLYA